MLVLLTVLYSTMTIIKIISDRKHSVQNKVKAIDSCIQKHKSSKAH